MTERGKRTDAEVWEALEKITAEVGELERIDALSDDELDRELRAAGIEPEEAANLGQDIANLGQDILVRVPPQAPGPPAQDPRAPKQAARPPRKVHWVAWAAVAAVAVLVVGVLATRPENVASPRPDDSASDAGLATKLQAAAKLRDDAFDSCAHGVWAVCEHRLDAARALDPAGEQDAKVLAARRSVYDAQHADAGHAPDKPVP
jgi:hypothetical protein